MPITPVNFDEDQEDQSQYEEFVDEVIAEDQVLEASPTQQASSIDSRMAEMEERLEMIQYYKLLLNGGFFNNAPNAAVAQKIEKEVAEYILSRLDSLLNMGAAPIRSAVAQSQFTEEEAAALKVLAQPETHKVLTEVVTRVFSKIQSNTKAKPAKTEAPKLAPRTVPQETIQKKPTTQPVTVKAKTPVLSNQPTPLVPPAVPKPVQTKKSEPGQQKKQFKKVTRINQTTGEPEETQGNVNITPQARPMGPIQPIPVASSKAEIEMQMQMSAQRTSTMGLNIFDQKLTK